jgi:hypothetical protein
LEQVEMSLSQGFFTVLDRREPDRLDHLDLERLDDGLHGATGRQDDKVKG